MSGTNIVVAVNADDIVMITAGTGTSGKNSCVAKIDDDPFYNNKDDPSTKTFKLKYG